MTIGMMICHGTLVQYQSGTVIRQKGFVTTGSTSMSLIVKIPSVYNQTYQPYYRPCSYGIPLTITRRNESNGDLYERYNALCKTFGKLRRLNLKLKRAYQDQVERAEEAISLLTVPHDREQRSIFSAVRHVFNIGSYDAQRKLQYTVEGLREDQISTNGEVLGLKFVIAHQSDQIKRLQTSAGQVSEVINDLGRYADTITEAVNEQISVQHYRDQMLFELMAAGVLANQLFDEYSEVVQGHMQAFAVLSRHYLPPSLLAPQDLQTIVNKLITQIQEQHPFLRLQHENIYTYYSMDNVNSFLHDGDYFLEIPVLLKMYDQQFHLYSLETIHLPLPNQPNKMMKLLHKSHVAVNLDSGTYMTLDDDWKRKLHCTGRHNIYCNNVITEQYTAGAKNCELAIVQNKTGEMREYCKMALVDVAAVPTKVHRIKNNKVLLENARGEDVYRKCMNTNNKQFVTRDKLAELDVPCFCALQSDSMTTSLITSEVCIETPKVKLYDPLQNILFLQLLLNTTTLENVTLNMIPYLNMPELITDFDMDDDKQLLNMKDVLSDYKSNYYNSAKNTLSRHEDMAKSFSIFKICAIMAPIIGVIVVLFIVFISIKTKGLGQLISLISLSKSTQALPVNDNNNFISSEWYDLAASVCTAVLLGLWLLYLSLRYYRLFLRMYRTITLPFHECVSAAKPPSYKVVLYLSSFNSYCYLYIDNVLKYPEGVVTQQLDTVITLTYHSTICNSFVTLDNTDISLVTKAETFLLPRAISVPLILRHTVQSILASDYKVDLMIGSGSHFRVLPVRSLSVNLPVPVEENQNQE